MMVPGALPEGKTVKTIVVVVGWSVAGTMIVDEAKEPGRATMMVPGMVPEGAIVDTVIGSVIPSVAPVYCISEVTNRRGYPTTTILGSVPLDAIVVRVTGPVTVDAAGSARTTAEVLIPAG